MIRILLLWPLAALAALGRALAWIEWRVPSRTLRSASDHTLYLAGLWSIHGLGHALSRWPTGAPRWAPRSARVACKRVGRRP